MYIETSLKLGIAYKHAIRSIFLDRNLNTPKEFPLFISTLNSASHAR